ncbi:MAG: hypothetical protein ACR2HR_04985 [Euzebya sp.]
MPARGPTGLRVADQLAGTRAVWSVGHMDAEVLSALGRLRRAGPLLTTDERLRRADPDHSLGPV